MSSFVLKCSGNYISLLNKRRRRGMKNKKVIFLLMLVTLLLAACAEEPKQTNQTITKNEEQKKQTDKEEKTDKTDNEKTSNGSEYAKVGETVTSDKWKISLISAKKYKSIESEYMETKPDKKGNIFVVLFFEVENVSEKNNYFNSLYTKAYVDDYDVNLSLLLTDVEDYKQLSGNIDAGKKMKGYLAYSVPSDFEKLEFIYDDGVFTSNEVSAFKITKKDLKK